MQSVSEYDIKRAYKKLKASVYYDKTQLLLRNKIVEYDADPLFMKNLSELYAVLVGNESKWNKKKKLLLASIEKRIFPKEVAPNTEKLLIRNDFGGDVKINKVMYFFDADVEVSIIGVLWILLIGILIDREIYEHSYGNRIRKSLFDENDQHRSFSPYLFEPYFAQYESWRNKGLAYAQECLENKQDAVIVTLDFKNYYHSVSLNKSYMDELIEEPALENDFTREYKSCLSRINEFIFEVFETYSKLFPKRKNIFLPIGFLPSNIIANHYLDKYDKEIVSTWNPLYYGRYVDDIIIVDKIEKKSKIREVIANEAEINHKTIIEYFLTNCYNDPELECDKKNGILIRKDDGDTYTVNKKIFCDEKVEIEIQDNKVKLFYFNCLNSDALISSFMNHIQKNKSEFRLLPDEESYLRYKDYTEIYSLKYDDTINKFSKIGSIEIDKYSLSKFLGISLKVTNMISDVVESEFEKDIKKIFNSKVAIDNYLMWEKIITMFAINNRFSALETFISLLFDSIDKTRRVDLENKLDLDEREEENISLKNSLIDFLYSAISRGLSYVWGSDVKDLIDKIDNIVLKKYSYLYDMQKLDYDGLLRRRNNYCGARMCDKYLIPIMVDEYLRKPEDGIYFNDAQNINLTVIKDYFQKTENDKEVSICDYEFYPYIISPQEIGVREILKRIKKKKVLIDDEKLVNAIKEDYMKLNFKSDSHQNESLLKDLEAEKNSYCNEQQTLEAFSLKVGNGKKKKLKIAIANIKLEERNFIDTLTGTPNRSYSRYKEMSKIINTAILEKADMLVFPESFVPIEWISVLSRISANTQMAIITGVEHIVVKDSVYNLTASILPYKIDDYKYSHISMHTKVHYSPNELESIEGYSLKAIIGKNYLITNWNDIWFSTYCCYELTSIIERSIFHSIADLIIAVEWNRDTNYYSNIIESLSRDLHCYCVQVNSSDFGDSRITQPAETYKKDILKTKGGLNNTALLGEVDVRKLRRFQLKNYNLQKHDNSFKPTTPVLDKEIVKKNIRSTLWGAMKEM